MGYVRNTYDDQNSYTKTSSAADALQVQIQFGATCNDLAILTINGPTDPAGVPYFGAVGGSGGSTFATGSLG
jgi:hypothetical protein